MNSDIRFSFLKLFIILFLVNIIELSFSQEFNQKYSNFNLQTGDLLFQDLDCGSFCDAIEKVTCGYNGAKFSHIGIAAFDSITHNFVVIEAVSPRVKKTPLDTFLSRSCDKNNNPKVVVGRLKDKYRYLIPLAIAKARKLIGKQYDNVFDIHNDKYYCSELIYQIFYLANNNKPVFQLQPMTFNDPDTRKYFKIWVDYFNNLKIPIPEGKLGINPGSISRSDKINIIFEYGIPEGWEK